MSIIMYLVPAVFSVIMLINGALRYWGRIDRESADIIFPYLFPSKREERNWEVSQKIYGRNLLIAGLLNVITEIVLIPIGNQLLDGVEQSATFEMLLFMFLPSLVYMFGARLMVDLKLRQLEKLGA